MERRRKFSQACCGWRPLHLAHGTWSGSCLERQIRIPREFWHPLKALWKELLFQRWMTSACRKEWKGLDKQRGRLRKSGISSSGEQTALELQTCLSHTFHMREDKLGFHTKAGIPKQGNSKSTNRNSFSTKINASDVKPQPASLFSRAKGNWRVVFLSCVSGKPWVSQNNFKSFKFWSYHLHFCC